MKANLKDIIDTIPDFEDLSDLAGKIAELSYRKLQLENKIKALESTTFARAINEFSIEGKKPSVAHIQNAYMHTGIDGEILPFREDLALIISELDKQKILMSLYRDMMEMFRTVSANERSSTSF